MVTPLLRRLPQHAKPASRRRAARARQGQPRRSRRRRGDVGARGQEAWRRRDAAAGIADARTRGADASSASALVASLDAAAAQKNNPGRYVLHRLNRTEYANAVRDLLGVTVDVAELLPSDGGDFGFDNIATALTTSPLLLERYLTAAPAGRASSPSAMPAPSRAPRPTRSAPSSRRTSTSTGCRSARAAALLVPHHFPADGEYVFSGRLLKTVAEGLRRRRGTRDAASVHRHHRWQAGLLGADRRQGRPRVQRTRTRRVARRVRQAHDVAAHQGHRRPARGRASRSSSARRRNRTCGSRRCATARRRTTPPGMPRLRNGDHRGPVQRHRRQRDRVAAAAVRLHADDRPRRKRRAPTQILSTVARRAFRRPVTKADMDAPLALYSEERERRRRLQRRHSRRPRPDSGQSGVPVPLRSRTRAACPPARRIASPISSWRAGCRSSSGAASRTTSC